MKERLIFHVDVNSAFLSWESARRVRTGLDDLRLVPSVIGGDATKRTGIVLAKSIPAKKYGIITGEPLSMALRKCPGLIVAPPDFALYQQCSHALMEICGDFSPHIEKFSIDECFLDMSDSGYVFPDPIKAANELRERVKNELGFTVNIGVGSNKLLAKMASDFEKPDKVHTLFSSEVMTKMWPLPVEDLFSVGKNTAQKLRASAITTIGELAEADISLLRLIIGEKASAQLKAFANGCDDSPVRTKPEDAKGYSISTTLESDVTAPETARSILVMLADSVTFRMRNDGAKCGCIGVTVRANDFKDRSHQRKLSFQTDVTAEVVSTAAELLSELWNGKTPLRLIGVALTDITRGDEEEQINLFSVRDNRRARRMDEVMDSVRSRFGMDSVIRGSALGSDIKAGKKFRAKIDSEIEDIDDTET